MASPSQASPRGGDLEVDFAGEPDGNDLKILKYIEIYRPPNILSYPIWVTNLTGGKDEVPTP